MQVILITGPSYFRGRGLVNIFSRILLLNILSVFEKLEKKIAR